MQGPRLVSRPPHRRGETSVQTIFITLQEYTSFGRRTSCLACPVLLYCDFIAKKKTSSQTDPYKLYSASVACCDRHRKALSRSRYR